MPSPSQSASPDMSRQIGSARHPIRTNPVRSEDIAYQAVTIASILLVLVSAWVF